MQNPKLYEQDFYAWAEEQAKHIRQNELNELDLVNLLDEVESMSGSQKRELESRLIVILTHLLKLKYQPTMKSNSWLGSIVENRSELYILFKQSPSLKISELLQEKLTDAYKHAVKKATIETELNKNSFPKVCEWNITQILDEDFLPN